MLALVIATVVVAVMENKAQAKAKAAMAAPQSLDEMPGFTDPTEDGFGEPDPLDSFGTDDN